MKKNILILGNGPVSGALMEEIESIFHKDELNIFIVRDPKEEVDFKADHIFVPACKILEGAIDLPMRVNNHGHQNTKVIVYSGLDLYLQKTKKKIGEKVEIHHFLDSSLLVERNDRTKEVLKTILN